MSVVKLTNNTGETDIGSLTGRDSIFVIPFFQRPYKWKPAKLRQLEADLLNLVDGTNDVHFLGAVIIHGLPSNPADPDAYELIDGQQRLTTIYLYMCAVVRTLIDHGELDEAESLFRKYLVASVGSFGQSNVKLQSSKEDQGDMNAVIRDILSAKNFDQRLSGFTFRPLPGTHESNQRVASNYSHARRFFRKQLTDEGIERLRDLYTCLLQRMSVVQIDVKDPTNGPKIFDSLNSGQEPMTIGDLVRNDVFAKTAASDPDQATLVDEHYWEPFYARFKDGAKNHFDDYFFPFGLIFNANLKKSDVYGALKQHWKDLDPKAVIDELNRYQSPFLDLKFGTNRTGHDKEVFAAFLRFHKMGAPSSVYPFLMRLSVAILNGEIEPSEGLSSMEVLDSFLTRRAICGHEPTGLHAVFKGLWGEVGGKPTGATISERIAVHKTVVWPTNEDVVASVSSRALYGTAIDRYVLMQFDESLGGDDVSALPMWIEHVLPQSSDKWSQFTALEHGKSKDLFANLIPLSVQMNQQLQNSAYSKKSPEYEKHSAFRSAREFAERYADWTPVALAERSAELSIWVVARWPHARAASALEPVPVEPAERSAFRQAVPLRAPN